MEIIKFLNVSGGYEPGKNVLKSINVSFERGERVGLIGANGAGKSTFMKALLGLVSCDGDIFVDGVKLSEKNVSEIREKLGFVLQNSDNQMFMPTVYDDMKFGPMNYGLSRSEADKRIEMVLTQLGIEDLKDKYNHKISGGEKRMAAIATVLAMEPEVIVMDEPTSSLDPYNRRKVINAITSLDKTMLIASHDLDMILETCERVILMTGGEIVAAGTAKEILSDKELLERNRLELPLSMQNMHR